MFTIRDALNDGHTMRDFQDWNMENSGKRRSTRIQLQPANAKAAQLHDSTRTKRQPAVCKAQRLLTACGLGLGGTLGEVVDKSMAQTARYRTLSAGFVSKCHSTLRV